MASVVRFDNRRSDKASEPPAQHYYPAPVEIEDDGFDLKQILTILRRRRSIIMSVILIGTCLAVAVGLTRPDRYTGEAMALLQSSNNVANLQAVVAGLDPEAAAIESEIRLITSYDFLEKLVDEQFGVRAIVEYEERLENAPMRQLALSLPEDWRVALRLDDSELLNDPEVTKEQAYEFKLGQLRRNLGVRQSGRSRVIIIAYESGSPQEAARIANAAAQLYIDEQISRKTQGTSQASDWLKERVLELEEDLRFTEQKIEDYRIENNLAGESQVSVDTSRMMNLTTMLIEARTERQDKEVRLDYIRELQSQDDNLQSLSEVINSPLMFQLLNQENLLDRELAELLSVYGERHPQVLDLRAEQAKLAERVNQETENIIRNINNEIVVLRGREGSIQNEINGLEGKADLASRAEVELRSLESQAEATRTLYEGFLQRLKEVEEQQTFVEADARIIQQAKVPSTPSSPGPVLFGGVGFVAATLVGLLLAFARERLDNSVRSGKELEREFGVPAIGLVPFLKRSEIKKKKPHEYLLAKPLSVYAETIRTIYTNLRLQAIDREINVIQVTSAVPAEGKTTLAVSLAAGLAQAGFRTILVDLDLRHPSVYRELPSARHGLLLDYLMGDCELPDAILQDEKLGFDVITLSATTGRPPNPTRILSSARTKEMLYQLRGAYDYVVVDSTPVLGVTDSKLAMELVDTVLFVVKWEQTSFDIAADAFKELQSVGADIAGVVVTQVDMHKHATYGYGGIDNYYSKYNEYYTN